jgi:hypothetical protein
MHKRIRTHTNQGAGLAYCPEDGVGVTLTFYGDNFNVNNNNGNNNTNVFAPAACASPPQPQPGRENTVLVCPLKARTSPTGIVSVAVTTAGGTSASVPLAYKYNPFFVAPANDDAAIATTAVTVGGGGGGGGGGPVSVAGGRRLLQSTTTPGTTTTTTTDAAAAAAAASAAFAAARTLPTLLTVEERPFGAAPAQCQRRGNSLFDCPLA